MVSVNVTGFSFCRGKSKYWWLAGKLQYIITIFPGILLALQQS